MTATHKRACTPIQLCQLTQLVDSTGKIVSLKLTFADYKHNYNRHPFSIVINRKPSHCPVESVLLYLKHRGPVLGQLFIDCGKPITHNLFLEQLSRAVKSCGLDSSRYKDHSFCIGAASYAADRGLSDSQIRTVGRWQSNAFTKYIRIPSLST